MFLLLEAYLFLPKKFGQHHLVDFNNPETRKEFITSPPHAMCMTTMTFYMACRTATFSLQAPNIGVVISIYLLGRFSVFSEVSQL